MDTRRKVDESNIQLTGGTYDHSQRETSGVTFSLVSPPRVHNATTEDRNVHVHTYNIHDTAYATR